MIDNQAHAKNDQRIEESKQEIIEEEKEEES